MPTAGSLFRSHHSLVSTKLRIGQVLHKIQIVLFASLCCPNSMKTITFYVTQNREKLGLDDSRNFGNATTQFTRPV